MTSLKSRLCEHIHQRTYVTNKVKSVSFLDCRHGDSRDWAAYFLVLLDGIEPSWTQASPSPTLALQYVQGLQVVPHMMHMILTFFAQRSPVHMLPLCLEIGWPPSSVFSSGHTVQQSLWKMVNLTGDTASRLTSSVVASSASCCTDWGHVPVAAMSLVTYLKDTDSVVVSVCE